MKVNYDGNTKKFVVDFSWFDRVINIIIVIVVCLSVLYGIFKPDIKDIFVSKAQPKPGEEVVFTAGNQLSWQEYRSIVGDKKLMKRYAKVKSTVTGYMPALPTYNGYQYVAAIIESADADDFTVFIVKFTREEFASGLKVGAVTVTDDCFKCGSGYSYLYCYDPIVINETAKG